MWFQTSERWTSRTPCGNRRVGKLWSCSVQFLQMRNARPDFVQRSITFSGPNFKLRLVKFNRSDEVGDALPLDLSFSKANQGRRRNTFNWAHLDLLPATVPRFFSRCHLCTERHKRNINSSTNDHRWSSDNSSAYSISFHHSSFVVKTVIAIGDIQETSPKKKRNWNIKR